MSSYFFKFGAKIPISIDFVKYFVVFFQIKKADLFLQVGFEFLKQGVIR
ncbi:hypothetical protein HJ01_01664 [Flavobacterium frigoris PS1]|uniref:Uncharacterized protein n=1 Tax=Flavobacterium frigoris (strain PS1) TaxID=1086011 RepID=H7FRB5_FLAFP|nr:hypothetical protein HJ01_01664 [Flavobacterium frigoris PS1]